VLTDLRANKQRRHLMNCPRIPKPLSKYLELEYVRKRRKVKKKARRVLLNGYFKSY